MSYRGSLKAWRPKYSQGGARASVMARSRLAVAKRRFMAAGGPRRNRAPRVKGAIAPYAGRQELKYVDTLGLSLACNTTGTVTCLNLLAVGDDNNTRDGRQITIKSVQLRGKLQTEDASTAQSNKLRAMLVWDNANNSGALPTIATILETASPYAFPKIDNANRFTILKDYVTTVGGSLASYSWGPIFEDVEIYLKMNNVTQYSGTTAAIGSIANGSLLLVTIGDAIAGEATVLTCQTRVRFTDS